MNYPETISIEEYLAKKGIQYKKTGKELVTKCVFCEKENHLYFNAETSQYDCKVCGEQGNIFTLAKFFGDDIKEILINNKKNMEIKKIIISETEIDRYNKALPNEIKKYLNDRGITNDIIEKNKLGWGNFYGKHWITIPIRDELENCHYFKLRENPLVKNNGPKYIFSHKGSEIILYGLNSIKNCDHIVICEGEFDQMILEAKGISAISSTGGAGTFKTEWGNVFSKYENIYLCFDNDDPGNKGMEKISQQLLKLKGPKISKIMLPKELGDGGDITDYFLKGFKAEDLFEKYSELQIYKGADENDIIGMEKQVNEKQKASLELVDLIMETGIKLFVDQFNEPFVAINGNGCKVIGIDSKEFDIWMYGIIYESGNSFGSETMKTVKRILSAKAFDNKNIINLSVRVAEDKDNFWYDLGEKAIKINKDGWEISNEPLILFRRFKHQKPQVTPQNNGSINDVFKFINVKNDFDKILLKVYIVSSFIPGFPHPVLVIFGEQGSAKSSTFQVLKSIIDPSNLLTIAPIKNPAQFIQLVSHHWMAPFDNLSGISNDLSDCICRACTGEGFSKRKLFTDDDDCIYNVQHCIGINGISNIITKADLLDRSLLIELKFIPASERKGAKDLMNEFDKIKPQIIGSCFDILSKAIKIKPGINIHNLPRMADFAQWGYVIAEAMEIGGETFMKAYRSNIDKQNEEAIFSSPIGIAIIQLLNKQNGNINTEPTCLLNELNEIADEMHIDRIRDKTWPNNPKWLWRRIVEIAPNLKAQGILIDEKRGDKRYIIIEDTKRYSSDQNNENGNDLPSSPSTLFKN